MFQPGHKYSVGGFRPGAGRPSKHKRDVIAQARKLCQAHITRVIKPVLKAYTELAMGCVVKKRDAKTGEIYEERIPPDPATTRHLIDKLLPDSERAIDLKVEHSPEGFYRAIAEMKQAERKEIVINPVNGKAGKRAKPKSVDETWEE